MMSFLPGCNAILKHTNILLILSLQCIVYVLYAFDPLKYTAYNQAQCTALYLTSPVRRTESSLISVVNIVFLGRLFNGKSLGFDSQEMHELIKRLNALQVNLD